MAKKKTSAELAKEQSEIAKVEGMLGDAFGSLGGLEQTTHEEVEEQISEDSGEEVESIAEEDNEAPSDEIVEDVPTPWKKLMLCQLNHLVARRPGRQVALLCLRLLIPPKMYLVHHRVHRRVHQVDLHLNHRVVRLPCHHLNR